MGKKQSKLSLDDQEHYIFVHQVENIKNPYFPFIRDIEFLLDKSIQGVFGSKDELLAYLKILFFSENVKISHPQVNIVARSIIEILKINHEVNFNIINNELHVQEYNSNIWQHVRHYYDDLKNNCNKKIYSL